MKAVAVEKQRSGWIQKVLEPFFIRMTAFFVAAAVVFFLKVAFTHILQLFLQSGDGLANLMCSLWFRVAWEMSMVLDPSESGCIPFGCIDVPLGNKDGFSLLLFCHLVLTVICKLSQQNIPIFCLYNISTLCALLKMFCYWVHIIYIHISHT